MQKFIIKPNMVGDLAYANTTSGSYYGTIVSNWSRSRRDGKFHIEVPPNTTATVYIPAEKVDDVRESGKLAGKADGVTFVEMKNGRAVFTVGSGEYTFVSSSVPVVQS